ncbi:MAG: DUF460 domain-containing protein [Nanobdellota archaeon]
MKERPLIVGIDPGTTCAYACLNLEGETIEIYSAKGMNLSQVIQRVSKKGLPVLASSDKGVMPDFVKQFAAKTSARAFLSNQDLLVEDKKKLAKNYSTNNDHERDALASAILAFKRNRALINKIKRYITLNKKEAIANKIFYFVLTKEISIDLAVNIIEKNKNPEFKKIKKAIENKKIQGNTKLLERLNNKIEENELLKQENKELKSTLKKEKKKNKTTKKENIVNSDKKKLQSKNSYINSLQKTLKENLKNMRIINDRYEELNKLIHKDYVLAKRLSRFSKDEINKKAKFFTIKDNDILYIDSLSGFSQNLINELKNRNIKLIANNAPNKIKKEFTVITEKELNIKKTKYCCFIDKKEYEKSINNKNILKRVLENYKKGRK